MTLSNKFQQLSENNQKIIAERFKLCKKCNHISLKEEEKCWNCDDNIDFTDDFKMISAYLINMGF